VNFRTIQAFAERMVKHVWSQFMILLVEFFVDPLLLVVSFGLLVMTLTNDLTHVRYIIAAAVCWKVMREMQAGVGLGFMEEHWHHTIRQTFSLPFKLREMVMGNAIYGVFNAGSVAIIAPIATFLIFGTFYTPLDIFLLVLLLIGVWGAILGALLVAFSLYFGEAGARWNWIATDIVVLTSGVFYPVSILPLPLQWFATVLPSTYLFQILKAGYLQTSSLAIVGGLFVVYIIFAHFALKKGVQKAKDVGRLVSFF